MLHFLYIGHFEHDGPWLHLIKCPNEGKLKPVPARPLNMTVVRDVFKQCTGQTDLVFPPAWCLWLADGYLICEPYARAPQAIHFIVEVAKRTQCEVWLDFLRAIPLPEVLKHWGTLPALTPAGAPAVPSRPTVPPLPSH